MASPSSSIGFALTAGFIVYITVRGELPAYLCVVGIGSGCPTPPATVSQTSSPPASTSSTTINNVNNPPISTTTNINTPPSQPIVTTGIDTQPLAPPIYGSTSTFGIDPTDPTFGGGGDPSSYTGILNSGYQPIYNPVSYTHLTLPTIYSV